MLSIDGLSHTYPNGVKALNGIQLRIGKGMFGLLGPNGAGKSTLMRTIATLQKPTSGQLRLDDIDILRQPEALRRVLGYLPQDFGVYPRGSAYQLLDHLAVLKGLVDRKARKREVEGLLEQTNLFDVRKKNPDTFSGGMRRRFGIAQALLGRPRLIIVDEPTAGLDPEERRRFNNLLSEIGRDIVVILSTHIVSDVSDLCADMAVINQGRIVAGGEPAALVSELRGRVWHKVIGKQELALWESRCRVISQHLSAGQLRIRVCADHCPDPGFESTSPTLEDVYFLSVKAGWSSGIQNQTVVESQVLEVAR